MDWAAAHRLWEKWAAHNVGSSGEPLKAALLLNSDPSGPSRLLSVIAEQEGINLKAVELYPFLDFVKRNNLPMEYFFIGQNQYLVTSIHEHWFCARCVSTSKPAGEGVIVMQTAAYLLVAIMKEIIEKHSMHSKNLKKPDQPSLDLNLENSNYARLHKQVEETSHQLRQMTGEALEGLTIEELQQIEKTLEVGLSRVLERKGARIMEQIDGLQKRVKGQTS